MSAARAQNERRLLDLLADRAVFGLAEDQSAELETLTSAVPTIDLDCMDRIAAAVQLSSLPPSDEMIPPSLVERLRATASALCGNYSTESESEN